ncbi:MAG: hypothetical protein ACRKFN_13700 [Desulfitobacterium sp.]
MAYDFQFGGCRIITAAKAVTQKMEAAKKHRAHHAIFFKRIPLSSGYVYFILYKVELSSHHQRG